VQSQGIGLGAVVVLGGHDLHLHTGQALERLVKGHDALGAKAIVIGNENFHAESCLVLIVGWAVHSLHGYQAKELSTIRRS
jgi:hypothetical protein